MTKAMGCDGNGWKSYEHHVLRISNRFPLSMLNFAATPLTIFKLSH
jgi:hypothetical protein